MSGDEAASGYNAWAIGHYGVDEYGRAHPLYFESFHDFKSAPYFYLLAPLTRVLPLTPYVVRLPAAALALVTSALAGLAAWKLTGSRAVATLTLMTGGLMPWLVVEGRFATETVTLTFCIAAFVACLVYAVRSGRSLFYLAAGLALAGAVLSHAPGRLEAGLLLGALVAAFVWRPPHRAWLLALPSPVVAYAILGLWMLQHPGVLTARFDAISILSDHPGPVEALARFVVNYAQYFLPPFLLILGDHNPRHATGFGGLLLLASAPAIVFGLISCWRRRREPLARFALLGLALAPVAAALTNEGVPHGPRAASMIPFVLLLAAYGWQALLPRLGGRPRLARALLAVAAVQAVLYFGDLYLTYPLRAQTSFDVGVADAVIRAHQIGGDQTVWLSNQLDQPYAQAAVRLTPDPREGVSTQLKRLHIQQADGADVFADAQPGDLVVAAPSDHHPAQARVLFEQDVPGPIPGSPARVAVIVYEV